MKFQKESIGSNWSEAQELMAENNDEVGALDSKEFAPDLDRYLTMEGLGILHLFTARKDNKLVGYAIFLISNHLHYPNLILASQDVVFISPTYRGIPAVRFIDWTDQELRTLGVHAVLRHVTSKLDYSRTLERMHYAPIETAYLRRF